MPSETKPKAASTATQATSSAGAPPAEQSVFGLSFQGITSWIDRIAQRIPWFAWLGVGVVGTLLYRRSRAAVKKLTDRSSGTA